MLYSTKNAVTLYIEILPLYLLILFFLFRSFYCFDYKKD
jgi:hypothetical protein